MLAHQHSSPGRIKPSGVLMCQLFSSRLAVVDGSSLRPLGGFIRNGHVNHLSVGSIFVFHLSEREQLQACLFV